MGPHESKTFWYVLRVTAEDGRERRCSLLLQDSDDIRYMAGALKVLGIKLEENWEKGEMVVHGCGGIFPSKGAELFLGNAGTAMRPLAAAVAAAGRGK